MADITMCSGGDCPLKENCYRFLAEEEKLTDQTYFARPPFSWVEGEATCKFFWKIEESDAD
ncbi:MAG: hypothetical protein ABJH04_19865 [Cyclobacteriaceae bacterium]